MKCIFLFLILKSYQESGLEEVHGCRGGHAGGGGVAPLWRPLTGEELFDSVSVRHRFHGLLCIIYDGF